MEGVNKTADQSAEFGKQRALPLVFDLRFEESEVRGYICSNSWRLLQKSVSPQGRSWF